MALALTGEELAVINCDYRNYFEIMAKAHEPLAANPKLKSWGYYMLRYEQRVRPLLDNFAQNYQNPKSEAMKNFLGLTPEFDIKEEIILRDFLAIERTRLANERTLLSYIRAALYMLLGGVAAFQLKDFDNIQWFGYACLSVSGLLVFIGVVRYVHLNKQLKSYFKKTGLQK